MCCELMEFRRGRYVQRYIDTKIQVADIFTTPFKEKGTWERLRIMSVVDAAPAADASDAGPKGSRKLFPVGRAPQDKQKRCIVEWCCGDSSYMRPVSSYSRGAAHVRITEQDDDARTQVAVNKTIHALEHKSCLLWGAVALHWWLPLLARYEQDACRQA